MISLLGWRDQCGIFRENRLLKIDINSMQNMIQTNSKHLCNNNRTSFIVLSNYLICLNLAESQTTITNN